MNTVLSGRRWLIRNVRRLVGNEQIMQTLHRQSELISSRLPGGPTTPARTTADPITQETASPVAPSDPNVLVHVNGDPLIFPKDLLCYIDHTRVSAPDADVPLFLIETPHYCWIRERLHVGANVLDVGANLGLFSIMMAKQVKYGVTGWVHAFEPSPRSRHDLGRLLACNQVTNVAVWAEAAADRRGKAVFHDLRVDNVNREASHLLGCGNEKFTGSLPKDRIEVDTIDLDSFVEQYSINPQLIKIDVEGAEFLVLEGARRCIEQYRPLLVIEVHPDETGVFDGERLHRFLDQYGYQYRRQDKIYYCE
jgi:FkbM family methyltransferase